MKLELSHRSRLEAAQGTKQAVSTQIVALLKWIRLNLMTGICLNAI
ncbi:MAG: hypothetical protein V7K81_01355 [Nostoc sp.]